jgi:hypothetical protein
MNTFQQTYLEVYARLRLGFIDQKAYGDSMVLASPKDPLLERQLRQKLLQNRLAAKT